MESQKKTIVGAKFAENPHIMGKIGHFDEKWLFFLQGKAKFAKRYPL